MGSFRTKTFFKEKLLKVANSLYNATEWVRFLKTFKIWFFEVKYMGFLKKNWLFQKPLKIKINVVGCNWISKISQSVGKVASSWKKTIGFSKKIYWTFLQTAKGSKFDAECNRISKFSLNVQKLVFCWKKIDGIFDKYLDLFKITKRSIVALQGHWKTKIPQNVAKLVSLIKLSVFFETKLWFPWKNAKVSKFTVECNWISKISQNVRILAFFWKKNWFLEKLLSFLKTANGSNFAVECNWNNRISQNVKI